MVRATFAFLSLLLMVRSPFAGPLRSRPSATRASCTAMAGSRRTPPIFIAGGRIERIDSTDAADTVPAERNVEASGRTLLPGLIDAHVHVEPWTLPLFLKYGVTSVRDVHNRSVVHLPARPRRRAASARVSSRPARCSTGRAASGRTRSSSPTWRRRARRCGPKVEAGAGVIKIYTRLRPAAVAEIVLEARARGVPVAAHLGKTTATEAAMLGVTSIEHLSGIAESASSESGPPARAARRLLRRMDGLRARVAVAHDRVARSGRPRAHRTARRPGAHACAARGVRSAARSVI